MMNVLILVLVLGALYFAYDLLWHVITLHKMVPRAMKAAKLKDRGERPPATEANTKIGIQCLITSFSMKPYSFRL